MQKSVLRIYKKIFTVFVFSILCTNLFARSGMLWGEKNLRVLKTKWFDIIYPKRCEESAAILYEKADSVYDEVTAQYGLTPAFRMPVVLTPAVDQFNAFWTAVPYNHIAIYDTGVSGDSELAVFSETLLSTFRHELTHAVTYNMKDPAWRFVGKIFGDYFSPGMLSITTGMAEGATLPSESAAGEGRLNDEYAKHYVKQAKIEREFPSYHDVSGAGDAQPGGAPYYFNGAFHQWLQETYGLAAYAKFWFRVVNGRDFTIAGSFKRAFGEKLKNAWSKFVKAYEVPEVAANPVIAGIVSDFFCPEGRDYSMLNDAGSLYDSLTSAVIKSDLYDDFITRLVWFDRFGGRVFLSDIDPSYVTGSGSVQIKPRQLFAMRGTTGVRISNDGRFIAVSCISENAPGSTAFVKIYDIERGGFYSVPETGLKEASIVCCDGEYYLIAQKYFAQHFSISVSKIVFDDNSHRIKCTESYKEIKLPVETNPFAFTPLDDGTFAYLKKERQNYSVCVSSVAMGGAPLREYAFPEDLTVRSLSAADGRFVFSYAKNGTLPRLGFMDIESGELLLSSEDISGGVFTPVLYKGTVIYTGQFYRQNRLLCMRDIAARNFDAGQVALVTEGGENSVEEMPLQFQFCKDLPSVAYNPFPYFLRGILIPVSTYTTEYFGANSDYYSDAGNAYLGFTYITANPWADGSSDLYTFTTGWNALSNAFGIDLQITKGTATSLFQSKTELKSEFDAKGWKQGGGRLALAVNINLGKYSTVRISNSSEAFVGKQDARFPAKFTDGSSENYKLLPTISFWDKELLGITAPDSNLIYYTLQNVVSLRYSNLRRAGPGRFEYAGFAAGLSFGIKYDNVEAAALGGDLRFYIPRLLPFESKYGYTYNFPLRLNAILFPAQSIYGYTKPAASPGIILFDATAETTVFSMDIQKAVPGFTALYINDFYVSAGYAGSGSAGRVSETGFQNLQLGNYFRNLFNGTGCYLDSVYLKTALELTPNIGVFARPNYKTVLITTFSYVIHSSGLIKPEERIKMSFGLDLNF